MPPSRVVAEPDIGQRRRHQSEHDRDPEQILHVFLPCQNAAVSDAKMVLPAIEPVPSWPLLKLGWR